MVLTRRQFNRTGATVVLGVGAAALLDACGFGGGGAPASSNSSGAFSIPKTANLQIGWWGSAGREVLTNKVFALMKQKYPGWTIAGQFQAFSDYWIRMNTLAAAGGLPDVFQQSVSYITQYATNNEMLVLDKYRPALHLDDFDKGQLQQGVINGKLVGISLGGNMQAFCYNKSAVQRAGQPLPSSETTWEGFATYCSKLQRHLPSGMAALNDDSGSMPPFVVFARQLRGEVFSKDGKLQLKKSDVQDWLQYWADLRKAGLLTSPSDTAAEIASGTTNTDAIATGKSVFLETWSNFGSQYQALMKDTVAMIRVPQGARGTEVGDYTQASQLFSVAATTKQPDAAVAFIDFFIHNPAAAKVLGVDRGVPASAATRKAITPTLASPDREQVAFLTQYGKLTRSLPFLDPPGSGDVYTALTNASQSISLSHTSVADASSKFMEDAEQALSA